MHLAGLDLSGFRNHDQLRLDGQPGLMVLVGPNGVGKTNILESLSLLAPGRGMRGVPFAEMIAGGGDGFAISVRAVAADATLPPVTLGTAVRANAPGRRQVRINGADTSASALGEWLSLLWLTPAMDRLFTEAAGGRRRFLDRLTLASEATHAQHANRYDAAMRARTRLLTQDRPADPAWLAALEAQMALHGAAIDRARHALVALLDERLARDAGDEFPAAALALVDGEGAAAIPWQEEALRDALARSRGRDAAAGRALTGPHRQDLSVRHRAKQQPAARCSTGEQKALLLGIVLGHADLVADQRGARPILLLDEVAAHLDPGRRAALFARLAGTGGQAWLTGTEAALFSAAPSSATILDVSPGEARRREG